MGVLVYLHVGLSVNKVNVPYAEVFTEVIQSIYNVYDVLLNIFLT